MRPTRDEESVKLTKIPLLLLPSLSLLYPVNSFLTQDSVLYNYSLGLVAREVRFSGLSTRSQASINAVFKVSKICSGHLSMKTSAFGTSRSLDFNSLKFGVSNSSGPQHTTAAIRATNKQSAESTAPK